MSHPPASKRARTSEASSSSASAVPPPTSLIKLTDISTLSPDDAYRLIQDISVAHPQTASLISSRLPKAAVPPSKPALGPALDFDFHAKSLSTTLRSHGRSKGSAQNNAAKNIEGEIKAAAMGILAGCASSDNPQTRVSGMETLCQMAMTVVTSNGAGAIGRVLLMLGVERILGEAMETILDQMEERGEDAEWEETDLWEMMDGLSSHYMENDNTTFLELVERLGGGDDE